jgi:hypothetical protein
MFLLNFDRSDVACLLRELFLFWIVIYIYILQSKIKIIPYSDKHQVSLAYSFIINLRFIIISS